MDGKKDFYSFNPNADRITSVKGEIDEVKSVMVSNIGEKMKNMKCDRALKSVIPF